jgi:predicted ribosome quality control (RQC) complex YloA/Tae2 family protein
MKHLITKSLMAATALLLFSCGGSGNKETTIKTKDGDVTVSNLKDAGEQMQNSVENAEKKREERRKKGDTLAMNYKELQTYLPDVSGYIKNENPSGESVSMPGMGSWSRASQRYESGEKNVEIELIDYNQSMMGYSSAAMVFGMNIQVENDREKTGTFATGIDNVTGYEKVYKTEQNAELIYAIADRFILTLKLNGSNDIDALKNIAKNMKLSELASK